MGLTEMKTMLESWACDDFIHPSPNESATVERKKLTSVRVKSTGTKTLPVTVADRAAACAILYRVGIPANRARHSHLTKMKTCDSLCRQASTTQGKAHHD